MSFAAANRAKAHEAAKTRQNAPQKLTLFQRLDALGTVPVPPSGNGWPKGTKIYGRDKKRYGRATGVQTACNLAGCTGARIWTVWPNSTINRPCSKGLELFADGWRIV